MKCLPIWMALALLSCQREERRFDSLAPSSSPAQGVEVGTLHAGGIHSDAGPPKNTDVDNAYAVNEGQRLYNWFNCSGCHARGGGAIGPPLMDERWIYGSEPQNIYNSIVEGRPNGMPSFRGKIPEQQVWQLVAYVRSLSALSRVDSRPSRDEHMTATPAPTLQGHAQPKDAPVEHPR